MDLRARSQRNAGLEDLRRLWCFSLNVKFCCEGSQSFGRHLDTDCLAQRRFRVEVASQFLVDRGEPHCQSVAVLNSTGFRKELGILLGSARPLLSADRQLSEHLAVMR